MLLMQKVSEALIDFMLNLEHFVVLMALVNTKKGGQTALWRKKRYGRLVQLLQKHLTDPVHFVKHLQQVIADMWTSLPAVQRLGSEGLEKLTKDSAVQRLSQMHLYVDSRTDTARENLAECTASPDVNLEDATATAEAEAELQTWAAEGNEDADEDCEHSPVLGDYSVSGSGTGTAQASQVDADMINCTGRLHISQKCHQKS